ncbi:zinc-binding alcohol dehydrogenase family protein [Cetobacterium sp. 8H]|uniref:zinc-binding alcohol dehydrogenase family protein n=1 Tax=Cetobacterium sp. 8H TaxID=2759681 RepID=UPI00163CFED3|nr:zinc-binding alcohol dehydrogenase family protein [Cetobacterium sp. 8H]MBC2850913.1 zinc-binding alcohol dehydrogenase family protein [Cetobacterium sp. 8H]
MKAIIVSKPKELQIVEREIPKISEATDVLVRIKAAGICGSDVHIYHGTSPVATYPRVIGHEMVGEVIDIGKEVDDLKIGDKVVIEPMIACGECYACKSGRPNACASLKVRGCHVDGGFQQYYVAPRKNIFKFDDSISWEEAAMIEPYTIADQITWRADIRKDDYVFIIGAGPIGLCVLEMAKLKGGICIISDFNEKRLQVAKELGADYVINPNLEDPLAKVKDITKGMGSNVTIDAVCLPKTFEQAIEITSVAGRVMCLGFSKDTSEIAQLGITIKELDIRGSRHQTHKFENVVQLFNNRKLQAKKLISNVIHFEDVDKAMDLIENKPNEICKIVLTF